jgi:putative oxidoreductase
MSYTMTQNLLILIGRIFFATTFITSGFNKILNFSSTLTYMVKAGIPNIPPYIQLLLVVAIAFELVSSFMVLLGWHTRIGAIILSIFVLSTCFAIHHFWSYPPMEAQSQMINFFKNIALLGGALYIISFGAGRYSFDGKFEEK